MESIKLKEIADWLKTYRKMYPEKSKRKHLHEFLRISKIYFEKEKEISDWELEWKCVASSLYLTYTIW